MKLKAQSSKALHAALQKAGRCILSKNTLVILDNVLLSMKDDQLFFTSSMVDAQLTLPAPLSFISGKFTSPIALPFKTIFPFLGMLPDCVVFFDFDEGNKTLTLDYCTGKGDQVKAGKVVMPYLPGDEFPLMKAPAQDVTHIALPASSLFPVIDRGAHFIDDDDDLHPVMACFLIDISEDLSQLTFAAASSHVLLKVVMSNDPDKEGGFDFYRSGSARRIMIHNQHFRVLSVFEGCELIDIEVDDNTARFMADGMELICKLVEGKYPNINSVIPKDRPYFIDFDKKEMINVIKRVRLFGSEVNNMLELKKNGMFLNVSTSDMDYFTSAEDQVLIADSNCNEGFKISFNSIYMLEVLAAIPTETVKVGLVDSLHAGVFTTDEPSSRITALCMPVISNY